MSVVSRLLPGNKNRADTQKLVPAEGTTKSSPSNTDKKKRKRRARKSRTARKNRPVVAGPGPSAIRPSKPETPGRLRKLCGQVRGLVPSWASFRKTTHKNTHKNTQENTHNNTKEKKTPGKDPANGAPAIYPVLAKLHSVVSQIVDLYAGAPLTEPEKHVLEGLKSCPGHNDSHHAARMAEVKKAIETWHFRRQSAQVEGASPAAKSAPLASLINKLGDFERKHAATLERKCRGLFPGSPEIERPKHRRFFFSAFRSRRSPASPADEAFYSARMYPASGDIWGRDAGYVSGTGSGHVESRDEWSLESTEAASDTASEYTPVDSAWFSVKLEEENWHSARPSAATKPASREPKARSAHATNIRVATQKARIQKQKKSSWNIPINGPLNWPATRKPRPGLERVEFDLPVSKRRWEQIYTIANPDRPRPEPRRAASSFEKWSDCCWELQPIFRN